MKTSQPSPVRLSLTFSWICPQCDRENFVPREDLQNGTTGNEQIREEVPLIPVKVTCAHCEKSWPTL